MRLAAILVCVALLPTTAQAQPMEGDAVYRVITVRAAPGEYAAFRDDWKDLLKEWPAHAGEAPLWMRHTQGDQWDFLFLIPLGEVGATPTDAGALITEDPRVARAEDLFALGPPHAAVRARLDSTAFYHIEMFRSLPGKRAELLEQRRMENRYLKALGRPQNFIFKKAAGIAIDAFTLGCYRDLKHFAESADIPLEDEDRAAKAGGFDSVWDISPYLRSLIAEHFDTLAVAVR